MTTDVGSFKSYQLSEGRTTPVSVRVSPTEKIRGEIDALFDGSRELSEIIEDVARLGARLIIQTAVEAEVDVFLGRAHYQRAAECPDARAGSRNGFCESTIKTTAGPVTVARPKLRGTTEVFASRLFGTGITKSNALEALVIAAFVRGLSVRDVEATLADALGVQATLSKSEVSRICGAIRDELAAWSTRRLDDLKLDYLFLDGSHFKYHVGAAAEPVLAAWGITTDGKPVLVGLGAAGSESGDAQADVKADYWAIFDVPGDIEPGLDAVTYVQHRIDAFARRWRDSYPAAVRCLLTDRDSLTAYLRFPREHGTRTRHSNFIERTFGETRRRVKVIGRLPGETSCMSLVWAVLDRASRGWRGVTQTSETVRLLHDLRRHLLEPPVDLGARRSARTGSGTTTDSDALTA